MAKPLPDLRSREVAGRLQQFQFSLQLLERNYDELRVFVDFITSTRVALGISEVSERWRQHEAMREVLFLLHNFVASALSLVDHSRVMYRELYEPGGHIPDYQSEIDRRFIADPLTQFVLGLRQMAQHYRLPSVGVQNRFSTQPTGGQHFQSQLRLDLEDLRSFGSWNARAKAYLAQQTDAIDIAVLARDYHAHVTDFYGWFAAQQAPLHGLTPAIVSHLTRFGVQLPGRAIIAEIEENLAALESQPRDKLTFGSLSTALAPALTILDMRALALLEHDATAWLDTALRRVAGRFEVPAALRDRFYALIAPGDPAAGEAGDSGGHANP